MHQPEKTHPASLVGTLWSSHVILIISASSYQTLESVPDIVSSSPVLKQLFSTLAATENSTQQQQQQQQQNGNITTQNGFGNTVNNKDLNANPQDIIDNAFSNQKMISNVTAETHL